MSEAELVEQRDRLLIALQAMYDAFKYTSHSSMEDRANEMARTTLDAVYAEAR